MAGLLRLVVLACAATGLHAVETEGRANPIRKVVTMLQNMQMKVTEEGKKEQELYDKFMCYCKTGTDDLEKSIADAEEKIEQSGAAIEEAKKKLKQLAGNLEGDKVALAEAKEAMSKATAMREKEAAEYAKESADLGTNVAALKKAIAALEKGVAGAFLQTSEASIVRTFAMEKAVMPDETRQELLAFLSGQTSEGYAPASGEIIGILKQLQDEMSKSLQEASTAEDEAKANYEALMEAKKKESAALQKQIEVAMARSGNLQVEIAEMENDLEDTKEALVQDQKFLEELKTSCATKTEEWEKIKAMRAEELVALADTIKILNDDDALELFKKTLPSAASSFMQLAVKGSTVKARALHIVKTASKKRASMQLDLIALALSGKKIGFEKVITMIDEMVVNLKKEQEGDDQKKEYCEKEFDTSEDKKKMEEQSIKDSEKAIEEMKGTIETLAKEIEALEEGIKALDKSVTEATEQRKEENADYKELMANDGTAKEVLLFAKNRLNKFYNPKLYKPPPKRELTEEERITVNMGGTLAPTAAPGGIAGSGIELPSFVQIRTHSQVDTKAAPPPPPETFGPYTKKSEEQGGVTAMIDLLVKDLDKEMQEAEVNEKEAQDDYEKMMEAAAAKRAADTKSITEKEAMKASTEEELEVEKDKKKATTKELLGTVEYIAALHQECDWLLQYFDARKEARSSEMEALTSAKAVLSGAGYSLVQTAARTRVGFMARSQ